MLYVYDVERDLDYDSQGDCTCYPSFVLDESMRTEDNKYNRTNHQSWRSPSYTIMIGLTYTCWQNFVMELIIYDECIINIWRLKFGCRQDGYSNVSNKRPPSPVY